MAIRRRNDLPAANIKLLLNKMNSTSNSTRLGSTIESQKGCARAKYDFAIQGGAATTVNLVDEDGLAVKLPDKAIITNCIIDVITNPTSASTPTIAIGAASTNDLKTATAIASLTGIVQGIPANTVGTAIKLSGEKTLTATIAGTTLTAGKFMVLVDFIVSE